MKFLFVSALVLLCLVLLYRRLRPYLLVARRVFGILADAQRVTPVRPVAEGQKRGTAQPTERLVCCQSCKLWVPVKRAFSPGPNGPSYYCSNVCMEKGTEARKGHVALRRKA